jgi:hypothetical protein
MTPAFCFLSSILSCNPSSSVIKAVKNDIVNETALLRRNTMKNTVCLVILFCWPLIYCNPCSSEQPQVSNEESKRIENKTEKLKQGQMPIPKDSEVKKSPPLTQGTSLQTEYKEATISIKGNPVKGNRDAKLVLIEFLDYQ